MFQGSNREKFIRAILVLVLLIIAVGILAYVHRSNSMTLADYEKMQESTQNQ